MGWSGLEDKRAQPGGTLAKPFWHFGQTFLPLWPNLWLGRFLIYEFVQGGKEHPAAHLECLAQLPYGRGWSLAFLCLFKPEGQNSIRGASQIWSLSKLGLTPLAAWGICCCVAFLGCMRGFWARAVVGIYILNIPKSHIVGSTLSRLTDICWMWRSWIKIRLHLQKG